MSVLRLSSLLISYSSVGKSEQGLGGVSQTELLLLSRDPVLRAHQEPDLTFDLDCITCTYKGGKPGEAVGERESVPAPAAWRYHTDISLEKDARSDSPAP